MNTILMILFNSILDHSVLNCGIIIGLYDIICMPYVYNSLALEFPQQMIYTIAPIDSLLHSKDLKLFYGFVSLLCTIYIIISMLRKAKDEDMFMYKGKKIYDDAGNVFHPSATNSD